MSLFALVRNGSSWILDHRDLASFHIDSFEVCGFCMSCDSSRACSTIVIATISSLRMFARRDEWPGQAGRSDDEGRSLEPPASQAPDLCQILKHLDSRSQFRIFSHPNSRRVSHSTALFQPWAHFLAGSETYSGDAPPTHQRNVPYNAPSRANHTSHFSETTIAMADGMDWDAFDAFINADPDLYSPVAGHDMQGAGNHDAGTSMDG